MDLQAAAGVERLEFESRGIVPENANVGCGGQCGVVAVSHNQIVTAIIVEICDMQPERLEALPAQCRERIASDKADDTGGHNSLKEYQRTARLIGAVVFSGDGQPSHSITFQ